MQVVLKPEFGDIVVISQYQGYNTVTCDILNILLSFMYLWKLKPCGKNVRVFFFSIRMLGRDIIKVSSSERT